MLLPRYAEHISLNPVSVDAQEHHMCYQETKCIFSHNLNKPHILETTGVTTTAVAMMYLRNRCHPCTPAN